MQTQHSTQPTTTPDTNLFEGSVTFSSSDLRRLVLILAPYARRRSLPILDMFQFERIRSGLWYASATDLEHSLKVFIGTVADTFAQPGRFLADGKRLTALTKYIDSDRVTFDVEGLGVDAKVTLRFGGTARYLLAQHDAGDYPALPDGDVLEPPLAVIKRDLMQSAARCVVPFVSTDAIRPAMMYVRCIHESSVPGFHGTSLLCATDGHRAAFLPILQKDGEVRQGFFIPPAFFRHVGKLRNDEVSIYMMKETGYLVFACGDVTFITRDPDEVFPNAAAVTPDETSSTTTAELNSDAFLRLLQRVTVTSSSLSRQCRWVFDGPDRCSVFTEVPERGVSGQETIECKKEGDDLTIGFNVIYARECLRAFGKNKRIRWRFHGANRAATIEAVNGDGTPGLKMLHMPVRLNTYA